MTRILGVAALLGALAPAAATFAQEAKPAPPARAVERSSPPPSRAGGGGGDRAVPRSAPPARAEASRPTPSRGTSSVSSDSGRSRSSDDQARQRTAPPPDRRGGSSGGDRAVPRGSTSGRDGDGRSQHVATARERGGRQSFGTATTRTRPPYGGHGGGYYYPRWYYPYYPLSYGFFWDPWWGYGNPWGYGYGHGYGYGYGYGAGYGYSSYPGPRYEYYGGLRLKVKPREAEVFVDGYFAGVVDDFDGAFQQLNLDVGPHRIEVRHAGYEPISFEIRTQPDQKITYKGDLKPVP